MFDVKDQQYYFSADNKVRRSELLKDVLAFANTRRSDYAYILCGVKENKPPPHLATGISKHLDDAQIQQYVNGQINEDISFLYQEVDYAGLTIGVFRIDPQIGPFFTRKDVGQVKKDQVYIRRGTTTKILNPGEIATYFSKNIRNSSNYHLALNNSESTIISAAMRASFKSLADLAVEQADDRFQQCNDLMRRGRLSQAVDIVDSLLEKKIVVETLSPAQRAKALGIKANVLVRQGELKKANKILEEIEKLDPKSDPTLKAIITLHQNGVASALSVIKQPVTETGKLIHALLLVVDGRPIEALEALPKKQPDRYESLRLQAIANLLLNNREISLGSIQSALKQEPDWIDGQITAGIVHYFSALSLAYKPSQIIVPDPIPPSLFSGSPRATTHLEFAESLLNNVVANAKALPIGELISVELWLLATLTIQGDQREKAETILSRIFSKDPCDICALMWALSYELAFDDGQIKKALLEKTANGTANVAHIVGLLMLGDEDTDGWFTFLERHHDLFVIEDKLLKSREFLLSGVPKHQHSIWMNSISNEFRHVIGFFVNQEKFREAMSQCGCHDEL